MYHERTIAPVIQKISETFPVLIVTGSRQVGKTTLLTHLAESDMAITQEQFDLLMQGMAIASTTRQATSKRLC